MADGQRSERPTPKRQERARREGQFPSAREFVSAVQFLAFVAVAARWGEGWLAAVRRALRAALERAAFERAAAGFSRASVERMSLELFGQIGLPLLVAGGMLLVVTLAAQMTVTRMGLSTARLAPDVARLNPLSRLRELPHQNLPALYQALCMLPLFGLAAYAVGRDSLHSFWELPLAAAETGARRLAATVIALLWKAAGVFLVFGLVDLVRQKRRFTRQISMSKQEIREEAKESEGNPHVRQRIRRLQRDLARRRMMREIPQATAIITNPTHYAVALRYHMEWMSAPVVVAKGKNFLALRIRALAREHQVPVMENPPLAQALYGSTEVGQAIPAHLYRAVAEILAYIYRLDRMQRTPGSSRGGKG